MLRRRHCLDQGEAARRASVSRQSWVFWENSYHLPRQQSIGKVARAFDIHADELLGRDRSG
jgi:DNA-binding XRE family transcriptional regulator